MVLHKIILKFILDNAKNYMYTKKYIELIFNGNLFSFKYFIYFSIIQARKNSEFCDIRRYFLFKLTCVQVNPQICLPIVGKTFSTCTWVSKICHFIKTVQKMFKVYTLHTNFCFHKNRALWSKDLIIIRVTNEQLYNDKISKKNA